jgi:hypothetical protein
LPQQARDVREALLKKGFKDADKKNPDHDFYFFYHNGKKTSVFTKISHNEREIHDGNCSNMAKQMKLSNKQFREFVDCPLELKHYLALLVQGRHILQRSLHVDKTTNKEVAAHCTACKRQFIGLQQIIEKEFAQHQCKKA